MKQNGHAVCFASKDLQAHLEIVMAAVKQGGLALLYASKALRKGGLKSYEQSALSKFNTPIRVFVDPFLCAARLLRFSPA